MNDRRDIIILDRTLCDFGRPETSYRMSASLDSLAKIGDNMNVGSKLIKFFKDPSTVRKTVVILFHVERGPSLRRSFAFMEPGQELKDVLDWLYWPLGAINPHESIENIKVISESEFLRKAERAQDLAQIVLDKMRSGER